MPKYTIFCIGHVGRRPYSTQFMYECDSLEELAGWFCPPQPIKGYCVKVARHAGRVVLQSVYEDRISDGYYYELRRGTLNFNRESYAKVRDLIDFKLAGRPRLPDGRG